MTQPKIGPLHNGFTQWQYDGSGPDRRRLFGPGPASAVIQQWELDNPRPLRRRLNAVAGFVRRNAGKAGALTLAFAIGASVASGPNSVAANLQLRDSLRRTERELHARQGELALARQELTRMSQVMDNSARYAIPADLAASIYDIARAEGIDPRIAFGLVNVESEFYHKAISPKGAVGLTQLMPSTARLLQPDLKRADLFDRETNLRLGFRYLREMINYYKGDVNLALTAYNRGPGTVDQVRRSGGDPSNGYAGNVLRATN